MAKNLSNPSFQFGSAASLPVGGTSAASAVGDFNKDGNPDVVFATFGSAVSTNLSVRLGTGNGTFGSAISLTAGSDPFAVAVADVNGDGNVDIVTANQGSDTVSVLLGNGDGTFGTATNFKVGSQPRSLSVGDFNGDGKLDVVTANYGDTNLSVLLGEGNGSFRSASKINLDDNQSIAVATGDFDRDGKLDLVTANLSANTVSLLLGNGKGGFSDPDNYLIGGTSPAALAIGDFNDDGKLDVATANFGSNSNSNISILFGNGKGKFKSTVGLSAGGRTNSIVAKDFNGDGNLDLATTNYDNSTTSVLLGNGKGQFSSPVSAAVGSLPAGVSTADFNQDGKPDLVVTSGGTTNASVLLNKSSFVFLKASTSKKPATIDGSKETDSSITVNLDRGSLVIKSSPAISLGVSDYEDVLGTQVGDSITGNDDNNLLNGNGGMDRLSGLGGNDTLIGGAGKDKIVGGEGNDRLTGGLGNNTLTGGAGKDSFIFDTGTVFNPSTSQDKLTDFKHGEDKIVLDRTTFTALGKKVSFAKVNSLDAAASSSALITYVRSTGRLFYNQDGSTPGFGSGGLFAILKGGTGGLTASDFSVQR